MKRRLANIFRAMAFRLDPPPPEARMSDALGGVGKALTAFSEACSVFVQGSGAFVEKRKT